MIGYASRTGTKRILDALWEHNWRLLVVSGAVLRTEGFQYGLDNGAWSQRDNGTFDPAPFLVALRLLGHNADFVVAPDIVGGGLPSLKMSKSWLPFLRQHGRRRLIAVQEGMTRADLEPLVSDTVGIFVGGASAEWKMDTLRDVWGPLRKDTGCYLHVGRVNSRKRILACGAAGADSFDGTSVTKFGVHLPMLDRAIHDAHRLYPLCTRTMP